MRKIFFSLLLVFATILSQAQSTHYVGNYQGTTTKFDGFNLQNAPIVWAFKNSASQMVFPSTDLLPMAGKQITSIRFKYINENFYDTDEYISNIKVYISEVGQVRLKYDSVVHRAYVWYDVDLTSPLSTLNFTANMITNAYEDQEIVIDLSGSPYMYQGSNLLITITSESDIEGEGISFYCYTPAHNKYCTASWGSDTQIFDNEYVAGGKITAINASTWKDLPVAAFEYAESGSPICPKPSDLSVSDVTANSATLTWTQEGGVSEWELQYSTSPAFESNTQTHQISNSTSFDMTNLVTNTLYYIRIKSDCQNGTQSAWNTTTLRTLCGEISAPWTANFSEENPNEDDRPFCWQRLQGYQRYPTIKTWLGHNQNGSLEFYIGENITGDIADYHNVIASPKFAHSLNNHEMFFWIKRVYPNQDGALEVGLMSDLSDMNTFQLIQSITPSTSEWQKIELYFDNVADTHRYIVFRMGTTTLNASPGYLVDDVDVHIAPSCRKPLALTINQTTSNSLSISWTTQSNATEWGVEYKKAEDTSWISLPTHITTTPSCIITGLDNATEYNIRVKSICSIADESDYSEKITAVTDCNEYASISNDFESNNIGTIPICWSKISTNPTYPSIVASFSSVGLPSKSVRFSGSKPQYLVTPKFSVPLSQLMLTFKLNREGERSGVMQVGYMSDPSDSNTFRVVKTLSPQTYKRQITQKVFFDTVSDMGGQNRYIAFRYGDTDTTTTSTIYYYWIDDVVVNNVPSCMPPTNLSLSSVSQTSAEITFSVPTGASGYEYAITTDISANPDTLTPVALGENTLSLNGLSIYTRYRLWLRSVCGSDYSDWSDELQFNTLCGEISVDWREDFNSNINPSNDIPHCWTRVVNSGAYPQVSINNSLAMYTLQATVNPNSENIIATPAFDIPLNNAELQFNLTRVDPNASPIIIGVMQSLADTSTFVAIEEIFPTTINEWILFDVSLATAPSTHKYIAFRLKSNTLGASLYYLDDIYVRNATNCMIPRNATIESTSITADKALVKWQTTGNQTLWRVEYKTDTDTQWNMIDSVATNQCLIEGLSALTSYKVRVKSLCSDSVESNYSNTVTFTTICATQQLPFLEDFENQESVFASQTCWEKYNKKASEVFDGATMSPSYNSWRYSQNEYGLPTGKAKINLWSYRTSWLVTPSIELLAGSKLEFDIAFTANNSSAPATGTRLDDQFMVIISTDGGNSWTRENATVWNNTSTGNYVLNDISNISQHITIDLAQYSGTIRIAFYGESITSDGDNDLHIDNIKVSQFIVTPPTVITEPADNITETSARLNKNITQGTYSVAEEGFFYKSKVDTRWRQTLNGDITGLTPATEYDFFAYAKVEENYFRGDTLSFRTEGNMATAPSVTTLAATVTDCNSAILSSSVTVGSESIEEQGFYYKKISDTNWIKTTNATINNLDEQTDYQYFAYATTATFPITTGDTISFRTPKCEVVAMEIANIDIKLYPNPASSTLIIDIKDLNTKANVTIIDMTGKEVLQSVFPIGGTRIAIDLSALSEGNYFVKITTNNKQYNKRLIIKR